MKVIALDPGVTTGFAYGVVGPGDSPMVTSAAQGKFSHRQLWDELNRVMPDVLVCESFEYRNNARTGLILYSCELIGIAHLFVSLNAKTTLCMQTASKGKSYYSDAHLKRSGVYQRGLPHGMDALRHLLHWYTFGPGYQFNKKGFI